jgi:hypothetical protein
MASPTRNQIDAAHHAWEATMRQWRLRKVSNYGMRDDTWLLENHGNGRYDAVHSAEPADEIAAHKFDGPKAEQTAKLALREKGIVAALTAALNA